MNEETSLISLPKRKGIYLLPNLMTVCALFAGFYAIVAASKQHFESTAIAIFVAIILDGLDGRIARWTNSVSEFGAQMDNLSDMVCFGVTPALVLYSWSLSAVGKIGWLAAFFYTVCAALRLARFNSQSQSSNKRYFQGLSTTACAGFVASLIWLANSYQVDARQLAPGMCLLTIVLGLLQVSTIRYRSFKDFDLREKVSFLTVLILVLIFVFISFAPPDFLFLILLCYVLSGPLGTLWLLRMRKKNKKKKD